MGADISLVAAEVLTLFCMMLVGVAARLFQVFTKDSTKLLSSLLVNVTQPLLILTSLQITYTEERLRTGLHIALVSAVFHVALSLLARLVYGRVKNARVLEFGTVFANCAYLGYPVLVVVFGEEGLFYGAFSRCSTTSTSAFTVFICSRAAGKAVSLRRSSTRARSPRWSASCCSCSRSACPRHSTTPFPRWAT